VPKACAKITVVDSALCKTYANCYIGIGGTLQFDAHVAKLMNAGQHFTITDCPRLRLTATATRRSCIYRYKSPVDGRMRQAKIGEWPAMSISSAVSAWEKLHNARLEGVDAAAAKKDAAANARVASLVARQRAATSVLTVSRLRNLYFAGRIQGHRKEKGAAEAQRIFATMPGNLGDLPVEEVEYSTTSSSRTVAPSSG
jgi:hypothetical protein